jgi:hypothetical protein
MSERKPLPSITDKAGWIRWFAEATKEEREQLRLRRLRAWNE